MYYFNINKKNLLLFLLILSTNSIFSASNKMYISLGGGIQTIQSTLSANSLITMTAIPNSSTWTFPNNLSFGSKINNIPFGRFGLGYGHQINQQWYIGLETNYYLFNKTLIQQTSYTKPQGNDYTNRSLSSNVQLNNQFGLSGIIGYQWKKYNLLNFVRLAYVNANLSYSNKIDYKNGDFKHEFINNANKRISGGLLGIGFRLPVSQHWSLSTEYDYTQYEKSSFNNLNSSAIDTTIPTTHYLVSTAHAKISNLQSFSWITSILYRF